MEAERLLTHQFKWVRDLIREIIPSNSDFEMFSEVTLKVTNLKTQSGVHITWVQEGCYQGYYLIVETNTSQILSTDDLIQYLRHNY